MSQQAVSTVSSPHNKASESKDIDLSSIHAKLRLNKQQQDQSQTAAIDSASPSDQTQVVDDSLGDNSAPARMTRKRAAHLANLEDAALHKSTGNLSRYNSEHFEGPGGPMSSICLCQPDPKIPRPRNAFILYRQRHQQNIVAQHPGLPNPEISKIAGELWRAEPEEVKNEWKLLAEEEKSRHAQQYPDYRFQPRHRNKTSPTSITSEKVRCHKCGGRSIIAAGSPLPTPSSLTPRGLSSITPRGIPSSTSEGNLNTPLNPSHLRLPMLHGLTINSPRGDPRVQPTTNPSGMRHADATLEDGSSEAKRRRYNAYNANSPNAPRQEGIPSTVTTLPVVTQYPYPSPREFDGRRGSLPPAAGSPYHTPRSSLGRLSISPSADVPRSAAMGPPPRTYAPTRNGLHAYPVTPITGPPSHGFAMSSHSRNNSESLRLPPLMSPSISDQSRSVEAMVMSMPYLAKIKLLRRIATPLKESILKPPGVRVRGSIITVEGDDKASVDGVLRHLSSSLKRSDEFDVRIITGPNEPRGPVGLKEYLVEVAAWHDKTKEMIAFITGTESVPAEVQVQVADSLSMSATSSRKGSIDGDKVMTDDASAASTLEEGEINESPAKDSQDSQPKPRAKELERKKEEMVQSIERESEKRRKSEQWEKERKIPLLLVSNYILHASDVWASAVPIHDAYSPSDHWQWVATLWRGIVGADMTVYVKSSDKDEPGLAMSPDGVLAGKPLVNIREDIGALVLKKDKDNLDASAIRRMAFEVGELARAAASAANAPNGS